MSETEPIVPASHPANPSGSRSGAAHPEFSSTLDANGLLSSVRTQITLIQGQVSSLGLADAPPGLLSQLSNLQAVAADIEGLLAQIANGMATPDMILQRISELRVAAEAAIRGAQTDLGIDPQAVRADMYERLFESEAAAAEHYRNRLLEWGFDEAVARNAYDSFSYLFGYEGVQEFTAVAPQSTELLLVDYARIHQAHPEIAEAQQAASNIPEEERRRIAERNQAAKDWLMQHHAELYNSPEFQGMLQANQGMLSPEILAKVEAQSQTSAGLSDAQQQEIREQAGQQQDRLFQHTARFWSALGQGELTQESYEALRSRFPSLATGQKVDERLLRGEMLALLTEKEKHLRDGTPVPAELEQALQFGAAYTSAHQHQQNQLLLEHARSLSAEVTRSLNTELEEITTRSYADPAQRAMDRVATVQHYLSQSASDNPQLTAAIRSGTLEAHLMRHADRLTNAEGMKAVLAEAPEFNAQQAVLALEGGHHVAAAAAAGFSTGEVSAAYRAAENAENDYEWSLYQRGINDLRKLAVEANNPALSDALKQLEVGGAGVVPEALQAQIIHFTRFNSDEPDPAVRAEIATGMAGKINTALRPDSGFGVESLGTTIKAQSIAQLRGANPNNAAIIQAFLAAQQPPIDPNNPADLARLDVRTLPTHASYDAAFASSREALAKGQPISSEIASTLVLGQLRGATELGAALVNGMSSSKLDPIAFSGATPAEKVALLQNAGVMPAGGYAANFSHTIFTQMRPEDMAAFAGMSKRFAAANAAGDQQALTALGQEVGTLITDIQNRDLAIAALTDMGIRSQAYFTSADTRTKWLAGGPVQKAEAEETARLERAAAAGYTPIPSTPAIQLNLETGVYEDGKQSLMHTAGPQQSIPVLLRSTPAVTVTDESGKIIGVHGQTSTPVSTLPRAANQNFSSLPGVDTIRAKAKAASVGGGVDVDGNRQPTAAMAEPVATAALTTSVSGGETVTLTEPATPPVATPQTARRDEPAAGIVSV